MIFHIVISVILVLGSIMFFDYEFSALRGEQSFRKVFGQAMFSVWFALIAGLALSIPLVLALVQRELSLGFIGQIIASCICYVMWFFTSRWLYGRVMQSVYHGAVTGKYRCQVAADDADITPD